MVGARRAAPRLFPTADRTRGWGTHGVGENARFIQLNGPGRCEAISLSLGRSCILPTDDGLAIEPGDKPGSLATIVADVDRIEVQNNDEHADLILNGRYRKPFGTKLRVRHGDVLTVGDLVLLYDAPSDELTGESISEVVVPAEKPAKIIGTAPTDGGGDALEYIEKIEDRAKAGRRMKALLDVAALVGAGPTAIGGSMKQFFKKLLAKILKEIPADRGSILVLDDQGGMRRMASHPGKTAEVSKSIIREVCTNKIACMSRDAMGDDRFSGTSSVESLRIRSALCAPLLVQDDVAGIINIDSDGVSVFTEDDLAFLNAIASQAALSLENARLARLQKSQEKMRHELKLAASIQRHLLPKQPPEMDAFVVGGRSEMAQEVGGDYYDYLECPDDDCLYLCIGDVKGSGLAAGLVLASARSYFHSLALWRPSPKRVLEAVNKFIHADTEGTQQMTVGVVFWDGERGHFVVSGAGHRPLILWRKADGKCSAFDLGGQPLGVGPDAEGTYTEKGLKLESGDLVVLFTDGVEKALGSGGMHSFVQLIEKAHRKRPDVAPQKLADGLVAEVLRRKGAAQDVEDDDVTVVCLRMK